MSEQWDIAIIGAGMAGAVAASRLARRGLDVLLLDKAEWPRDKVCGGCVNAAAVQGLAESGLDVTAIGRPYSGMRLVVGGHQAHVALPPGRAVTRRLLDANLVDAAVAAGAVFSPMTHAAAGVCTSAGRTLHLNRAREQWQVRAKVVLSCDGLGGRVLDARAEVSPGSRIGAGTVLNTAPGEYAAGTIHMACTRYGYVGLVRVEEGRLNIGAALDPAWVKRVGGPAAAVARVLESARLPAIEGIKTARWRGTPYLTRYRRRLGSERILALGDAAGYIEPFTGEGMAWAIAGATAVEPLAVAGVHAWRDELVDRWTARHQRLVGRRQQACRAVSAALRRPRVAAGAVRVAAAMPVVATPLAGWLNRKYWHDNNEAVDA